MVKLILYVTFFCFISVSLRGQQQDFSIPESLKKMTTDNQLAQLSILSIECHRNDAEYLQNVEKIFKKYDVGGVYLQGGSYEEQMVTLKMCKANSRFPLFIASDILTDTTRISSLPSLLSLSAIRNSDTVPFQIVPDSTQIVGSFLYEYGASLARQYKAMGFNLFLLPMYEEDAKVSSHDIANSLGVAEPLTFAKMIPLFGGIQSEQVLPSLKFYNSAQHLSPENLREYLQSVISYKGFNYVDSDQTDNINARRIFPNCNFFIPAEQFEKLLLVINDAFVQNILKRSDIYNRCQQMLETKSKMADIRPSSYKESRNENLLYHQIYQKSVTIVKNEYSFLPIKRIDTLRIASINFGSDSINPFQQRLSSYARIKHFSYKFPSRENSIQLLKELNAYNCVIIYNSRHNASAELIYLLVALGNDKHVVLCSNDNPTSIKHYLYTPAKAIVSNYDQHPIAQDYAAQAIFGGIRANGILPMAVNYVLRAGYGIETGKTRLSYNLLPDLIKDIDYQSLSHRIDSICEMSIDKGVTPGCQVLISKGNQIIFNKAYGYHTYEKKVPNQSQDIYDIASLTKISATLPAVMKLYCENRITIDSRLATYCPEFKTTDKRNITVRQLLTHTSGVRATINPFTSAINCRYSPNGSWSSEVRTKYFYQKLSPRLYINPKFAYKSQTLSNKPKEGYEPITQGIYVTPYYRERIQRMIVNTPIQQANKYIYSDLGFVYLQRIVESVSHTSLDTFCKKEIFDKIGAYSTDFNAVERLDSNRIVPSCNDKLFRHAELCGVVHDPMAAFLGGVAGNAGLFSSAEDLAKIMTLYLNDGSYGEEQIFCKGCVQTFSKKCERYPRNRRGLGFDKPGIKFDNVSIACKSAPQSSFGHTGFTGTMAWCDPDNQLVYIFLSNRTYPNEYNNKLLEQGIRTKIQSVIYDCLKNPSED